MLLVILKASKKSTRDAEQTMILPSRTAVTEILYKNSNAWIVDLKPQNYICSMSHAIYIKSAYIHKLG